MGRVTGTYRITDYGGETVRAFVPAPLASTEAEAALGRLGLASELVPSAEWFLYGFVRKEAVVTSQIEGTAATLRDVVTFEATHETERPDDVREVCNYVDALTFARREISRPRGLPLSTRLL